MTIFGFNTDVRLEETVYHIQSEARQSDLLLQTLVFVKGQCVGKHTVSFAQKISEPGFSHEAVHELLKEQHRLVVEALQQNRVESVVGPEAEIQDVGGSGLSLKCESSELLGSSPRLTMRFHVSDWGRAVPGAVVSTRAGSASSAPVIARGVTDSIGNTQMEIPLSEEVRQEAAVIVQAVLGSKSATRKFRLKKA
ncbi:MAG TPA: hypothetical protein VKZ53_25055 [Candidatus Angelobacter sp.]|nr:hypothetical protein [Candidatus Angelobacter sp.]